MVRQPVLIYICVRDDLDEAVPGASAVHTTRLLPSRDNKTGHEREHNNNRQA